jgi:polysaccharide biosynthesis protein PslJ
VDSRVRLHRTAFDAPLLLTFGAVFASDIVNPSRVSSLGSDVAKSLMFFLSFVLLYYFVVSVLRNRAVLEKIVRVLTACGTVVGVAAIVERRTGYNVFYHLHSVARFLEFRAPLGDERGGHIRVFGPAEDPIALGAALAMMIPLSYYLARTSNRAWWLSTVVLVLGIMGTASRTAVVMLGVIVLVLFWLQRADIVRLWPAVFPLLIVIHVATPGAIGTFRYLFNPPGGVVAEQTTLAANANPLLAGGRLRLLGPSIDQASRKPLLGEGWGTRLTGFNTPNRNAPILDDAWLGTLLEIGGIGVAALVWLMVRAVRLLGRASRRAAPRDSKLYAALAASIASFAVGMLTYDAFSFVQVTFIFWTVLAVAAAALAVEKPYAVS